MYKLEDRVLFDAALPVDVVDSMEAQQAEVVDDTAPDVSDAESYDAGTSSESVEAVVEDTTELVEDSLSDALAALSDFSEIEPQNVYIIDASVENYESIVDQLSTHDVIILSPDDSLESITEQLESYSDLDSISIITEGNTGYFELAGERVDAEFVAENSSLFESFGDALSESGDIKIFSCFTGRGEQGADLAEALATVTRADIGLSTNSTGDSGQGDWTLEYTLGQIENTTLEIETTGVRLESAGGTSTGLMNDYYIEKVNSSGTVWQTGDGDIWYALNSGEDLIAWSSVSHGTIGSLTYWHDTNDDGICDDFAVLSQSAVETANFLLTGDVTFDETAANVDWDGDGTLENGSGGEDYDSDDGSGGFEGIYRFKGNLNGMGYSIDNFYLHDAGLYKGFFQRLDSATISNINFGGDIDVNVGGNSGVLIGLTQGTGTITLENISVVDGDDTTPLLTGTKYNGVLVGGFGAGSLEIINCTVDGDVDGKEIAGGFVGYQSGDTTLNISNSSVENSTITAVTGATGGFGGFVGYVEGDAPSSTIPTVTIVNSTVDGTKIVDAEYGGGFVGQVKCGDVTVISSSINATSSIDTDTDAMLAYSGGIVGYIGGDYNTLTVTDCQSLAGLNLSSNTDNRAGGIIGNYYPNSATFNLSNSYYGGSITGSGSYFGGIGGVIRSNVARNFQNNVFSTDLGATQAAGNTNVTGATGMTSADMKTNAIETPMDFTTVNALTGVKWVRTDGSYPTLQYAAPGNITLTNSDTQVGSTYIEKTGDSITLGGDSPITSGTLPYKVKVTFSDGTNVDIVKYVSGTGTTGWTDNFDLSSSDLNLIKDTTYTVTVSAATEKGAAADSAVTASETFSLIYTDDVDGPTGTLTTAASGNYKVGDTIDFVLTLSDSNALTFGGTADSTLSLSSGGTSAAGVVDSANKKITYTYTVQVGDLDTDNTLTVTGFTANSQTVTDAVDNAYDFSSITNQDFTGIKVDGVAPGAPSFALAADTGSSNTDNITNDATVNVTLAGDMDSWEYSLDGGSNWTTGSGTSFELSDDTTYAIDAIRVRQCDAAGNVSAETKNAVAIETDMSAASAPSFALAADTGSSNTDSVTNDATVDVTLAGDTDSWEYSLDGGTNWTTGSGTSFELADNTTYAINDIQVRQTDLAGNTSSVVKNSSVIVADMAVSAPTVALANDTGSDASDNLTNDATLSIGAESGSAIEYSTDNTNWNSSFTATANASNTVYVRQTDLAGNTSSSSSLTFTLDTTAPAAPADPAVAVTTAVVGETIEITGTTGSPVDLIVDGAVVATVNGSWTYNLDTSSLSAGTIEVKTTTSDAAGNEASSSVASFELTAPESNPVVVDPVVETPTSSEPVTTTGGTETTIDAGLEDSLIVQETSIDTDVELYTGVPESTEQTMEQVAQQISQALSVAYSHFDLNVTVETPAFADTFNAAETAAEANAAANSNTPAVQTPAPQSQPMTMEVFKQLDIDTSGSLKVEELNQRYEGIDFDKADLNDDGIIDEDEFKKLIIEMEKGKNKPLTELLDSTHILESAPRYAQAFQTPLERSLAILAAV